MTMTVLRKDFVRFARRMLAVSPKLGCSQAQYLFVRGRCDMSDGDAKAIVLNGKGKYTIVGPDGEVMPDDVLHKLIEAHKEEQEQAENEPPPAPKYAVQESAPPSDPPPTPPTEPLASPPAPPSDQASAADSQSGAADSQSATAPAAENTAESQSDSGQVAADSQSTDQGSRRSSRKK